MTHSSSESPIHKDPEKTKIAKHDGDGDGDEAHPFALAIHCKLPGKDTVLIPEDYVP